MDAWRRWEYWGILFVVVAGSLLHFAWEWSGRWPGLAPVAAVNESVWEHLKLVFWPVLVWGAIELLVLRPTPAGFWPAKAAAAYVAPLLIVALHYLYRSILGTHVLALDLIIFVLAAAAAQMLSLRIITAAVAAAGPVASRGLAAPYPPAATALSALAIVAFGAAFWAATYFPPRLHLFLDSVTGRYGIL